MSFVFCFYILGFEPTLQLKGGNLRALQNETHMSASIWSIDLHYLVPSLVGK